MVVTTAMATMAVNRLWLRAPIDRPIVATMTSVEPRAFMPQPTAKRLGVSQAAEAPAEESAGELAEAREHDEPDGQQQQIRLAPARQGRC